MKLTEFISDVGRPIAYYPSLRKITGSTTATIFICQFLYWTGKGTTGDGWIYKTIQDIEIETGLSEDEQVGARKKLIASGLLEENYKRLEHQMYYRVNLNELNKKWEEISKVGFPETGNSGFGKPEIQVSLIGTTEITTETTVHAEKPNIKRGDLVDGIIEMSQMPGIKKSIRIDNLESIINVRLGITPTRKGWKDFLEFVDKRQQEQQQMLTTFLDWLKATPKFDVSFWGPDRMRENWDRAFISERTVTIDPDGGMYV